jgi:tetratricopeptide (TPR) repeat protein
VAFLDRWKRVGFRTAFTGLSLASAIVRRGIAEFRRSPGETHVMAEGFELVRTVRQHLRRSATLLDEGKFDEALAAVESALALDPQSLAAQALQERIRTARAATGAPVRAGFEQTSRSFVPHGVNAASWRGFEQRITERRFKAMLETVNTSIVAGDAAAARTALEEARELRPDAAVLAEFEARVDAVPVAFAMPAGKPAARIWVRAMGAAALFLIGVSLLLGLEWMRPGETTTTVVPAPVVAPEVPAAAPAQGARPAPAPDLGPVPVALNDEESVPAIVGPPEPLMRPTATTGTTPPQQTITARSFAMRETSPPALERTIERRPAEEEQPSGPLGEVADDFVASRNAAAATRDAGPAMVPPTTAVDTPVNADARGRPAPPAATPASAVSVPSGPDQQVRVQEVLRRYARAYGQLDAGAARAVWPSVDEKALARAFQNLSSQQVSFDDCEIDIRGVVANASCRGQASYAPKVGNRDQRTEPRTWQFELHRDGDAWTIENVDMRRAATGYR